MSADQAPVYDEFSEFMHDVARFMYYSKQDKLSGEYTIKGVKVQVDVQIKMQSKQLDWVGEEG